MKCLIGLDSTGTGCVKITKGTLDPVTTPDSQASAFYYNSKWSKDIVANAVVNPDFASSGYLEGGSSSDTATHIVTKQNFVDSNRHVYRKAHFVDLDYDMPLIDLNDINYATGRFQTNRIIRSTLGVENRGNVWAITSRGSWKSGYNAILTYYSGPGSNPTNIGFGMDFVTNFYVPDGYPYGDRKTVTVWNLPGNNTDIIDGAERDPISGQPAVLINSSGCKVAKPGFNVNTATRTQLAFDSSKRPPKILAADDILLPAGATTEYETGFTLPAGCVIDAAFYSSGSSFVFYPCDPQNEEFGAEQWISGSKVMFYNPNGACRARFMVISPPDASPTSGTNSVLRQFTSGGENVVQFLRPGAGSDPSFGDIVLDSRWPCLQILAEGYIGVADGANQYPISIGTSGLFPIVKFMTVHGSGSDVNGSTWTGEIRTPRVSRNAIRKIQQGVTNYITGGDTCYARVSSSEVRFFTFKGNPINQRYTSTGDVDNDRITYAYDPAPIIGIRYYVMGIAA